MSALSGGGGGGGAGDSGCSCAGCDYNVKYSKIDRCECGEKQCCSSPEECSCFCHKKTSEGGAALFVAEEGIDGETMLAMMRGFNDEASDTSSSLLTDNLDKDKDGFLKWWLKEDARFPKTFNVFGEFGVTFITVGLGVLRVSFNKDNKMPYAQVKKLDKLAKEGISSQKLLSAVLCHTKGRCNIAFINFEHKDQEEKGFAFLNPSGPSEVLEELYKKMVDYYQAACESKMKPGQSFRFGNNEWEAKAEARAALAAADKASLQRQADEAKAARLAREAAEEQRAADAAAYAASPEGKAAAAKAAEERAAEEAETKRKHLESQAADIQRQKDEEKAVKAENKRRADAKKAAKAAAPVAAPMVGGGGGAALAAAAAPAAGRHAGGRRPREDDDAAGGGGGGGGGRRRHK